MLKLLKLNDIAHTGVERRQIVTGSRCRRRTGALSKKLLRIAETIGREVRPANRMVPSHGHVVYSQVREERYVELFGDDSRKACQIIRVDAW